MRKVRRLRALRGVSLGVSIVVLTLASSPTVPAPSESGRPSLLGFASQRASRAPIYAECEKSAQIEGPDPSVVALVRSAVERGGMLPVATEDDETCPTVRAIVSASPSGYRVEMRGEGGQRERRIVSSIETAAILIESWVLAEGATSALVTEAPAAEPLTAALSIRPEFGLGDDRQGTAGVIMTASWISGPIAANALARGAASQDRNRLMLDASLTFGPSLELDFTHYGLSTGLAAGVRRVYWAPAATRTDFSAEAWIVLRTGNRRGLEYEGGATLQYVPEGELFRDGIFNTNRFVGRFSFGLRWGF